MKLCSEEQCSGCGACVNICPQKCITMKRNYQGFDYPSIDEDDCINCGQCEKVCHAVLQSYEERTPSVFSVAMKNDDATLKKSSSGGAAYILSKKFIEDGGIVFGAAYTDGLHVEHICVSDVQELERLQGSKYVQSSTGSCFSDVRKALKSGMRVLYFGTPCQIHGLYAFLQNANTDSLFTCDLLCGGVPSPGLFEKYIAELKTHTKSDFDYYNFRSKRYGYGYGYLIQAISDGKEKILTGHNSSFIKTIGAGYIRQSCIGCRFGSLSRVGDVTIGDFWNLNVRFDLWTKGVSLLFVNTNKGKSLVTNLQDDVYIDERTVDEAKKSQSCSLTGSKKKPKDYEAFYKDCFVMSWNELSQKYLSPKSTKLRIIEATPPFIMGFIRNVRRKMQT